MKNQAFHFEISDLIIQFISAFDNCVIKRFNDNRVKKYEIGARYVVAPKQRVLYDLVNKGKNLTLPAITVNMTSLTRDPTRVFNKIDGFHFPGDSQAETRKVGSPVPVNIGISMSIIAKLQHDIEQIISNFAAYTNPYFILVWKIPSPFNLNQVYEIRSEVEWSGDITLNYPYDITPETAWHLTADTSFTIKGWLFPEAPTEATKNIFFIDANFYAANALSGNPLIMSYADLESLQTLSAANFNGFTESIHISAAPSITNMFYSTAPGIGYEVLNNFTLNHSNSGGIVTLYGKRFTETTVVGLSSNNAESFYNNLSGFNFTYYDPISCYQLDTFTVVNDNILTIQLPSLTANGNFNIVVINGAGYDTSFSAASTYFIA